ncbi:sulfate/molybdate ABC transporter ATP-binding protein [Treponema endosymbiont of Eucomonympha sp.]|uniref:sulfate/molybdate ABC transporter ATP-binding protein n=1 Tax=Treponema endosymbiont of Eucomonympha sp. TaxID=1580831 RepID=UPI000750D96E|nr:ATP-binding cassette domain-containing protein [Treponema endosymbiont of Eucomonympha sp.]
MSLRVSLRKRLSPQFCLEAAFQTAGGCLGILGASGSGKSMTLKCIAGIETPDEGHISVNGKALFDSARKICLKPQARRVGYLFQHYALFPRMTLRQNVAAGLPLPKQAREHLAEEWLCRFGLGGLEARYPQQLSGGQQQRAALARMLVREPDVVLLDEPFSALDTSLREQMQAQFLELLRGRDAVMVTHSRDEAYKMCETLLVLDSGSVLAAGKTKTLFAAPGSVRVAQLTGCKNITPAKRTGEREIYAADWGLRLRVSAPVGDGITHAGVRAHDLQPAREASDGSGGYNQIRVRVTQRSEDPFEHIVLFANADAASAEAQGEIWWKYSKYMGYAVPERLFIPPEAILLLRA